MRRAVGDDVELLIEVHGRLTPDEAIRIGEALTEFRPFWYEEPIPPQNVDAMVRVSQALNIPLATGERLYTKWEFKDLIEKQAVAVVQPDSCQAGGILELKKIAAMAETYYIGFAPHNPYGPINTMASLHVVAGTPNFLIQEGGHADYDALLTKPFPRQKDGYLGAPGGPWNRCRARGGGAGRIRQPGDDSDGPPHAVQVSLATTGTLDLADRRRRMYRVGVLGCRGIGVRHGKGVDCSNDAEIVAGCDLVEDLRQEFDGHFRETNPNLVLYDDFAEMLENADLDILTIATGDDRHTDPVVAAAEAGVKGIFCEKPLAVSLEAADRMVEAVENHGVKLSVDHTRHWIPLWRRCHDLVTEGAIGEVSTVVATHPGKCSIDALPQRHPHPRCHLLVCRS